MKLDKTISERFDQLATQVQAVESTRRRSDYLQVIGSTEFEQWATSVMGLLNRVFGPESDHYVNFKTAYDEFKGWAHTFDRCLGIFRAARDDYAGGYLFTLRALVSADMLDGVMDQARELLEAGHKDPACVVAGVALEALLRELADRHRISHGKVDRMNADLAKAGVYNRGMAKQITAWAHWRNKAAHGEWDEYGAAEVEAMIEGVNRLVADHL